ncbi:MAG: hypothetical protein MAG794_01335 [Gammaproteobacteria bacterium]|nr:hypothetical protein [Gammaproteobacteria bacterium]
MKRCFDAHYVDVETRAWQHDGYIRSSPARLFRGTFVVKIDGACHCGYITYEAEIDLDNVGICHCTDCQTLSGSAFRTIALTREGTFKLLSGELKTYIKTGESGNQRPQSFCPECGSPIYSTSVGDGPKIHCIRAGKISIFSPRDMWFILPSVTDFAKTSQTSRPGCPRTREQRS